MPYGVAHSLLILCLYCILGHPGDSRQLSGGFSMKILSVVSNKRLLYPSILSFN